ncbi:MAG: hypothetical protein KC549_15805, partial [Myxococcales bacterium]|nr:hypothetical protein [Myxococcales bacterium]
MACEPDCAGRACGPDGCGGRCGDCGDGAVCSDGACVREGCPDDEFLCGGDCSDLLTDVDNCGSCGHDCVDAWSDVGRDGNIPFEDTGARASCGDAECEYRCPGLATPLGDTLMGNVDHCGACGNACRDDLANGPAACLDGQCFCRVDGTYGSACGNHCTRWFDNCWQGCCPELVADQVLPLAPERGNLPNLWRGLTRQIDRRQRVHVVVKPEACERAQALEWKIYRDNGRTEYIAEEDAATCGAGAWEGFLDPGFYSLAVANPDAVLDVHADFGDPQPVFVAPAVRPMDMDDYARVPFRLPTAGVWRVAMTKQGGTCNPQIRPRLLGADAESIVSQMAPFGCEQVWMTTFEAGVYTMVHFGDGGHELSVTPAHLIRGPDVHDGPVIHARNWDTVELEVPADQVVDLELTEPDGGCIEAQMSMAEANGDWRDFADGACRRTLRYNAEAGVRYHITISPLRNDGWLPNGYRLTVR